MTRIINMEETAEKMEKKLIDNFFDIFFSIVFSICMLPGSLFVMGGFIFGY